MMRSIALGISAMCVAMVVPVVRASDPLDYFLNDSQSFEEELKRQDQQILWNAEDDSDLSSSELLPPVETGTGIADEREEDTGPFVTIRIDGAPFDLSDVPRESWFAPYVRAVAEEGIVSGYRDENGLPRGLYGPADPVTIEQIAKIAALAARIDVTQCAGELKNALAAGRWSEPYFLCAEQQHWPVYSDGAVDPHRSATRAEVVATILVAFGREFRPFVESPFSDVDSSTEFRSAVTTAFEDHIVSGYSDEDGKLTGLFGPQDPVNRAETAKVVSLAIQVYGP